MSSDRSPQDDPVASQARPPGAAPSRALDWRVSLGLAFTLLWLGLSTVFVEHSVGWDHFLSQPLADLGSFFEGIVAPLAFLWLVLGLFLQQGELAENSRAIQRQYQVMLRTAEQAEIQTAAIAANELHARQDTFVELSQLVTRQLAVTTGFQWMTSQVAVPESQITDEEVDDMWSRFATGDQHIFGRRLISLRNTLSPREAWELFWGTPVRQRHSERYVHAFERLLATARGCDPHGMIVDALLDDVPGRLYTIIVNQRDAGPPPVP